MSAGSRKTRRGAAAEYLQPVPAPSRRRANGHERIRSAACSRRERACTVRQDKFPRIKALRRPRRGSRAAIGAALETAVGGHVDSEVRAGGKSPHRQATGTARPQCGGARSPPPATRRAPQRPVRSGVPGDHADGVRSIAATCAAAIIDKTQSGTCSQVTANVWRCNPFCAAYSDMSSELY